MASKTKTTYVCTDCGADYPRWQGQCNACQAWNTVSEMRLPPASKRQERLSGYAGQAAIQAQTLDQIDLKETQRLPSAFRELDRVLGGGFVQGSAILIGGSPGAGKSTLLLQTMCHWAQTETVLYVTGEESLQQVALRARRLALPLDRLQVLSQTSVEHVCDLALQMQPKVMVIDSIQVMHMADIQAAPGSVAQVRESAAALTRFAKQQQVTVIMVGHVTKEGALAGPKVLEHCIDCSLLLEGDNDGRFRLLRSQKNRFGAINELGVFVMSEQGLKEVSNPSAMFLSRSQGHASGSVVMAIWEGTRALLVELQALVDEAQGGQARRVAVGLDGNRMNLLLAVLNRHGGVMMGHQDVFVNVVAGVKVTEAGADLALLIALVASFRHVTIPSDTIIFGEVGLAGEIRPVPYGQERLQEARKHGFKRAVIAAGNVGQRAIEGLEVVGVHRLSEALEALF
jgi:DNA repair protein RadA/Sms